jgi:MoaA/NifB/PqqE/SkfB family radical SAM enzyme
MAPDMARRAFDALFAAGVREISLVGNGEPLIAPCFDDLLDRCGKNGVRVFTCTNGILLRDEARTRRLVDADVNLTVSVDGARPETYEFIRPHIKWEHLLEALECLARCVREAGKGDTLDLSLHFCAMRRNIADLPDLVRLAARYGFHRVVVLPLTDQDLRPGLEGESLQCERDLVSPAFLEARRLGAQLHVEVTIPPAFRSLILGDGLERLGRRARLAWDALRAQGIGGVLRRLRQKRDYGGGGPRSPFGGFHCAYPWTYTFIADSGAVHPCCMEAQELGSLERHWSEIWNGEPYRWLRRTIHSWNPPVRCRTCGIMQGINGGNEKAYESFFARSRVEPLALDGDGLHFEKGFHGLEADASGAPSHRWMARAGAMRIAVSPGAKFLRLRIFPGGPLGRDATNYGHARFDGGPAHPFDTSSDVLHFPLPDGARAGWVHLNVEMEHEWHTPTDPRPMALAICVVEILR